MDLDDAMDLDWWVRADLYYARASLANGNKVSDVETAIDEAAAEYVGHRAVTAWNAWRRLYRYSAILSSVSSGEYSVDQAKREILSNPLPIPVEYDQAMQRAYFGYEPMSDGKQVKIMKPIYSELATYCDGLLEHKVSSYFNQMGKLRSNYELLIKSMGRFPSLVAAMNNKNYPRAYSIGHPNQ
jgi:hypothetical protein